MQADQVPVAPALEAVLRRAVLDHRRAERRRCFAPRLQVGIPGGPTEVFVSGADEVLDHALRADIVAALIARARRHGAVPMIWRTRPGELDLQDSDVGWLAGARTAAAEAGIALTLVVVTRRGWFDPRSGARREWVRLRER